jgi:hypothetical protein
MDFLAGSFANLLTAPILFFALGGLAGLFRSDLHFPDSMAKGLSIYLMLSIGFKGGVSIRESGLSVEILLVAIAGVLVSLLLPAPGYWFLRKLTRVSRADAASIAAHYGSVSVVTFVTAQQFLLSQDIDAPGYMVGVMALMETPAILAGIWLARRKLKPAPSAPTALSRSLWREVFLNGSVVVLVGSMIIGAITGPRGMEDLSPFIVGPFKGLLCLFLLEMGLATARRLSGAKGLTAPLAAFGLLMPLVSSCLGILIAIMIGLPLGAVVLFAVLSASASYIAVPAAMRLAVPEANPGLSMSLSLAITFPFNIIFGIPLYTTAARLLLGV